ncbi:Protein Daple [Yarrowia sp. E02]|nr:Protein Daple [Yarrowia sp. E02]
MSGKDRKRPIWDSADPERNPPPLPMNPSSPGLRSAPTSGGQLGGRVANSPFKRTLDPRADESPTKHSSSSYTPAVAPPSTRPQTAPMGELEDTIGHMQDSLESLISRSNSNGKALNEFRGDVKKSSTALTAIKAEVSATFASLTSSLNDFMDQMGRALEDNKRKLDETSPTAILTGHMNRIHNGIDDLSTAMTVLEQGNLDVTGSISKVKNDIVNQIVGLLDFKDVIQAVHDGNRQLDNSFTSNLMSVQSDLKRFRELDRGDVEDIKSCLDGLSQAVKETHQSQLTASVDEEQLTKLRKINEDLESQLAASSLDKRNHAAKLSKLEAEVEVLRKTAAEATGARDKAETASGMLKQENEQLRHESQLLQTQNQSIRDTHGNYKDQIKGLTLDVEKLNEQLEAAKRQGRELQDNKSTVESVKQDHLSAFEALKEDHKSAIEVLKGEHSTVVENLKQEHRSIVDNLKKEHQTALRDLKEELKGEHKSVIDGMKTDHEAAINSQKGALKSEHLEIVASLKKEHSEHVDTLKTEHASAISTLKQEHFDSLEAFETRHKESIKSHGEAMESLKTSMSTIELARGGEDEKKVEIEQAVGTIKAGHAKEMGALVETHAKEVSVLKGSHSDVVESLKESHLKEIGALKETHATTVEELKSRLVDAEGNFNTQKAQWQEEHKAAVAEITKFRDEGLKKIEEEYVARVAELKQGHSDALDEVKLRHDEEMKSVREEASGHLASGESMKEDHKKELSSAKAEHAQELTRLKDVHDKEMASAKEEYAKESAAAKEEFAKQIANLEDKHSKELAAIKSDHKKALANVEVEHKQALSEAQKEHKTALSTAQAEHEKALSVRDEEHKQAAASAREEFDAKLSALEEKNGAALEQLKTDHESAVSSLKAEHVSSLATSKEEFEGQLASLQQGHTEALAAFKSLKDEHNAEVSELKKAHLEETQALRDGFNSLGEVAKSLDGQLRTSESTVGDLEKKLAEARTTLEQAVADTSANMKTSLDSVVSGMKLESDIATSEKNLKDVAAKLSDAKEELADITSKLADAKKEHTELTETVSELQTRKGELASANDGASECLRIRLDSLKSLEDRVKSLNDKTLDSLVDRSKSILGSATMSILNSGQLNSQVQQSPSKRNLSLAGNVIRESVTLLKPDLDDEDKENPIVVKKRGMGSVGGKGRSVSMFHDAHNT